MDIGAYCSYTECNREDFLPFECKFCKKFYCLDHRQPDNHFCKKQNQQLKKRLNIKKFPCIVCKKNTQTFSPCKFCNKNVCLTHRFQDVHPCLQKKERKWWNCWFNK